jgi:predicted dehydrogenase
MSKTVIGLIGCGNISDAYLRGAARSNAIRVKACSDLRPEAAQAKAAEYGVSACRCSSCSPTPRSPLS